MIEVGNQLAAKLQTLIQNGGLVAVTGLLLVVLVVKRSLTAVLGVGIVGAIALFGIFNPSWFRDKVKKDLGESGMAVVVDAPAPLDLSALGVSDGRA